MFLRHGPLQLPLKKNDQFDQLKIMTFKDHELNVAFHSPFQLA